jgi:hypothetical protein
MNTLTTCTASVLSLEDGKFHQQPARIETV